MFKLKLFVTGDNSRTRRTAENIRSLCRSDVGDSFDFVIVDVLNNPDAAEEHRILATPTLIRETPEPPKRIIGDMTNMDQIALALGLPSRIEK